MESSNTFHIINRKNIFNNVNSLLLCDSVLSQCPLRVKFEGEAGFDSGGVCRDMFSAYWEEAYKQFFDGNSVLTPVMHPSIDMLSLPLLGTALSHGYVVCGFIPTRIVFPSLACILLGVNTEVPSNILVEAFSDSLSHAERCTLKVALSEGNGHFSDSVSQKVIAILSRYGCRNAPNPVTLQSQLVNIAKFEFQIKPQAIVSLISGGILQSQRELWNSFSVEELYALYMAISGTPEKVLQILDEPVCNNENEAHVFSYLQQFIGDMKRAEIRRFLRFTTGSSVLLASNITVAFNSLSGLARHPIARTCSSTLELSSTYINYLDFENEFKAILSDDEFTWEMHAV